MRNITKEKLILIIGLFTILLSIVTWAADLTGWVGPCIYCRIERSIIGGLGIMMLLPEIPYFKRYFSLVIGFFGAQVAAEQIFLLLNQHSFDVELFLATCALSIIVAQVVLICQYKKWGRVST